jgi:hypothetical protein
MEVESLRTWVKAARNNRKRSVFVPVATLEKLIERVEQADAIAAERDRWAARMRKLEDRLKRVSAVAEGKE